MTSSTYKMRPKTILYNPADGDPSTWVNGVPPQPQPEPQPEPEQPIDSGSQGTDSGASSSSSTPDQSAGGASSQAS